MLFFPIVRIVHTHNLLQVLPLTLSSALSSIVIFLLFRFFIQYNMLNMQYAILYTLIMQSSEHCLKQTEKENFKKIRTNFNVASYIYTLKIYILLWKPGKYFNSFFPFFYSGLKAYLYPWQFETQFYNPGNIKAVNRVGGLFWHFLEYAIIKYDKLILSTSLSTLFTLMPFEECWKC